MACSTSKIYCILVLMVIVVPELLLMFHYFHLFGVASLTALFKHTEASLSTDEQIREKVLHFLRDKVRVFSTFFFHV